MRQQLATVTMVRVILILSVFAVLAVSNTNATPRITLKVQDTTVGMGNSVALKLILDNTVDSIAGFEFMLVMNRPDIARFDFTSIGYDTAGTLTSGSELIAVSDPSGVGTTIKFVCLRNDFFVPPNTLPIAPQTGGIAIKLRINTFPPPFPSDDTLFLYIQDAYTSFASPSGNSIGIILDTIVDTTGFKCLAWNGSDCLSWQQCSDIQACTDSIRIDSITYAHLDTTQVSLLDGKLAIPLPTCDNNGNVTVNIVDLLCVVNYLFGGFNPSTCPTFHCDANASGGVNVVDLTYLVSYLFNGGPPPR